jgi:hypothetical protein
VGKDRALVAADPSPHPENQISLISEDGRDHPFDIGRVIATICINEHENVRGRV